MRIIYCIDNPYRIGGIERVTIVKANALANIEGNEIWIVCLLDNQMQVFPIDEKIHIVSLDINYHDHDWEMNRFQQIFNIWEKKKEHKRKMKEVLDMINPDIVVSTDGLEKNILSSLSKISSSHFIREIHLTSNHKLLEATSLYTKFLCTVGYYFDYYFYIRRYDKIVVLTNEDKERYWKNNEKVIVIPNPITISHAQRSTLINKTVIAVGRLERQKNFSSLLRSWAIVNQQHPDWTLEIWGKGTERNRLEHLIEELNLQGAAKLMGATNDVIGKMAQSSVFVLSSLYEGFPLVIVEAMSCGLPIVSYECPCGPKDIIKEGCDGFLVQLGDETMLAKKLCHLIENERERKEMGRVALEMSKKYAMDVIKDKWMRLFKDFLKEKQ